MQKEDNSSVLIVIAFIVVTFFLINHNATEYKHSKIKGVELAGQVVQVDLALDDASHERGLSGRKSMAEDEGLLFIFNQPGTHMFWMKDMYISIDIIWISADMHVVYIKKDAQPEKFLETYEPTEPALYVLEVVSGYSDKYGLKVGDEVKFTY